MFLFRSPSARQLNVALAVLRVAVGMIFVAHGSQKLFVYGLGGVTGAFGQMGIPFPGFIGPSIALVEFFGGIALVIGLLTRLAALGIACDMIGAIMFVHFKGGFFLPAGYEYALSIIASTVALMLAGGGQFSMDALLAGRDRKSPGEAL